MIRVLVLCLLLVLAFPVTGITADEDLFAQAKSAAWAIYTRGLGKLEAICSATAVKTEVNKTWLISAAHCFQNTDAETVVTQDHLNFRAARVLSTGRKKEGERSEDWAVILIDAGPLPVIPIGNSRILRLGEDVLMVGLPFGYDFLAVRGIVGSTKISLPTTKYSGYLGFNLFGAQGNSGTGIISIKQHAVIAILVAGPGEQSSMTIGTPIHLIPESTFSGGTP